MPKIPKIKNPNPQKVQIHSGGFFNFIFPPIDYYWMKKYLNIEKYFIKI